MSPLWRNESNDIFFSRRSCGGTQHQQPDVSSEGEITHSHVDLLDATLAVLDDDHGATNATSVRSDMDGLLLDVDVDTDELGDLAVATEEAELGDEARTAARETEHVSVEVDDEVPFGVHLCPIEDVDICEARSTVSGATWLKDGGRRTFDSDEEANVPNRLLLDIGRDVGHERQVLDESARLSFGGITRAEDTPLTRLERTRSRDLARLLELRRDASHHPERRDERQPREDVSDPRTLHLESLERPVARRDGANEALRDAVAVELELLDGVEFGRAVDLLEDLVDVGLEIVVELLEEILEEQREELTSPARARSVHAPSEFRKQPTHSSRRLFPT